MHRPVAKLAHKLITYQHEDHTTLQPFILRLYKLN